MRFHRLLVALLVALPLLTSCATVGFTPDRESMPAARAALAPEYRLFYDTLEDYGDWTLIEPFGYVFRPYGNVVGWRPYDQGYWAASDVYGWVWISAEPFGWATYHYGQWIYDRFQGWVWIPGVDWAPAWVSWAATPDYVGWAPLGVGVNSVPGGGYLYAPASALASTDLSSKVQTAEQIGPEKLGAVEPVDNEIERGGVRFNAGPRFETIERRFGAVPRVKIEDASSLKPGARRPTGTPAAPAPASETRKPEGKPAPGTPVDIEAMRKAAEESARLAREAAESKTPPAQIQVVRPPVKEAGRAERERQMQAQGQGKERPRPREAPRDSAAGR
jgi:hypothetical protein